MPASTGRPGHPNWPAGCRRANGDVPEAVVPDGAALGYETTTTTVFVAWLGA